MMGYRYYQDELVKQGVDRAVWNAELDPESNSGAHANSEKFLRVDGGYDKMQDKSVPGNRDISVDWGSVDSKLGATVSFNTKAEV